MKIELQNICNIEHAVLDVNGVAFIGGRNAAGKTSACDAIGYVASGRIKDLKKEEKAEFVKDGSAESFVRIIAEEGTVKGDFISGEVKKQNGWGIEASVYAAGIQSLAELTPKDRMRELSSILKAEPTSEEWVKALTAAGIKEGVANTVSLQIAKQGPEKAHDHYAELCRGLKRDFAQITKTDWGKAKGGTWLPEGFSPLQDGQTVASLQKQLEAEEKVLEGLIRVDAVKVDDKERLKAEADKLPALSAEANKAAEEEKHAEKAYKDAAEKLRALPRPAAKEKTTPCPHCSEPIVNRAIGVLAKPATAQTEEEVAEINSDIEYWQKRSDALAEEFHVASTKARRLQIEVSDAKKAQVKMEEMQDVQPTTASEEDIQEARATIARLKQQISGTTAKEQATKKHDEILDMMKILEVLKPNGLRQEKLSEKFEDLNNRLAAVCAVANWETVRVADDTTLTIGGKAYGSRRTSDGQKFRIRCALQIAFAALQNCKLIVIDATEAMDGGGRGGLMLALSHYSINAVVSCMYSGREDVPDASQVGGVSYWLENGTAHRIGAQVAA